MLLALFFIMLSLSTDIIQDKSLFTAYCLGVVLKASPELSVNQALEIVALDYMGCSKRSVQRYYKTHLQTLKKPTR